MYLCGEQFARNHIGRHVRTKVREEESGPIEGEKEWRHFHKVIKESANKHVEKSQHGESLQLYPPPAHPVAKQLDKG